MARHLLTANLRAIAKRGGKAARVKWNTTSFNWRIAIPISFPFISELGPFVAINAGLGSSLKLFRNVFYTRILCIKLY